VAAVIPGYDAVFRDARGQEATRIGNDGTELRMTVRGVDFIGSDFDSFAPVGDDLERAAELFVLSRGELCACQLTWTMPLSVARDGVVSEASLGATLTLGDPAPHGGITSETLLLELQIASMTLRSSGNTGWFEDELLDLVRQLGDRGAIQSCFTCAYSDYSPAGHGLFGSLACFRDVKQAYTAVDSKAALFELWNRMTEYVQETHLCGDYHPRPVGTGYRG
jgi:hypothetical protein